MESAWLANNPTDFGVDGMSHITTPIANVASNAGTSCPTEHQISHTTSAGVTVVPPIYLEEPQGYFTPIAPDIKQELDHLWRNV